MQRPGDPGDLLARAHLGGGRIHPGAGKGADLRRRRGRRPHLRHHHPSRHVGQLCCRREIRTRGEGRGEGGDHRVAGAGHVEDLTRPSGQHQRRLVAHKQGHPLLAQGDEHRLRPDDRKQPRPRRRHPRRTHKREAGRLRRLFAVRGQEGDAAVALIVTPLRVAHHRDVRAPRQGGDPGHQRLGHHPLAVVGEDHRAAARETPLHRRQEPRLGPGGHGLAHLTVDAHELLAAGDHPSLHRRRPLRVRHQGAIVHAQGGERGAQRPARPIVPHHRADPHGSAEGNKVRHHVAGTTEGGVARPLLQHGHRRLGRDPLDLPPEKLVHHHVPHHEHAATGEAIQEGEVHGGGAATRRTRAEREGRRGAGARWRAPLLPRPRLRNQQGVTPSRARPQQGARRAGCRRGQRPLPPDRADRWGGGRPPAGRERRRRPPLSPPLQRAAHTRSASCPADRTRVRGQAVDLLPRAATKAHVFLA